jgi:quercetin dioxygenase-like cupin family protein
MLRRDGCRERHTASSGHSRSEDRRRLVKRLLVSALLVFVAAGAALALAGGQPISGGLIGSGVLTYHSTTVSLSQTNGFVMEWAKVPAGGSFGWHYHKSAVIVAVTAGTLTLYDSQDPNCMARRFSTGQGFAEPPNHVHIARNEGSKAVSLYAIYLGVPGKWRTNPTPLDAAAQPSGNCPAKIR